MSLQINCFLVNRNAYANLPQEAAHRVLEKEIERFGTKDNLRLYIDGPQAKEKQNTAEARETTRERALERVEVCLNTFESRLNENMRIRKRHHTDIKAGLASSFYWSHTSRTLFAEYLTTRGWTVLICTTEADLSIAQSIQANDVVITKDSDMLAYGSVVTIWRPVSNNVILEYKMPDLLRTLSFTRAQLTALAVVSRNDYHRNIYSLGPASNFGIIKKIENSEDPRVIIAAYLSDSQLPFKSGGSDMRNFASEARPERSKPLTGNPGIHLYGWMHIHGNPSTDIGHSCSDEGSKESRTAFIQDKSEENQPSCTSDVQTVQTQILSRTTGDCQQPHASQKDDVKGQQTSTTRQNTDRRQGQEWLIAISFLAPSYRMAGNWHPGSEFWTCIRRRNNFKKPETPLNLNIVQQEVVECIQEAVQSAANVKRNAQRLIGEFVETLAVRMRAAEETKRTELQKVSPPMAMTNVDSRKARRDAVTEDEREILTHLCVCLKPSNTDKEQQDVEQREEEDNTDLDDKGKLEQQFLQSFLAYLYSGNYPRKAGVGVIVNKLIDWLADHGFHRPIRARRDINETRPFTPVMLVRSVSVQLAVELQRIYGHGTQDLHMQATAMVEKLILPPESDISIQDDISAVKNFLQLNRITGNRRRIVPLTTSELPFVSFTEPELASFFWKREPLKTRLTDLVAEDGSPTNALSDIYSWIAGKGPGIIIKQFIADVAPQVKTSRQRRKAGHRGAVKLLTLEQIKAHLTAVQDEFVDPINYATKGYILRGSIRTDGFRLQLPAFKLRELQSVRYCRLDPAKLPPKLTSTVGGTDYYLKEIRHVITCKEDVEKLWPGVPVDKIKTLTLDGGQVCVIGAFADLAEDVLSQAKGKENASESSMEGVATTTTTDNQQVINAAISALSKVPVPLPHSQGLPITSSRTTFLNLAVKQKAVYQPMFRFRRWLEGAKQEQVCVDGQQVSISDIESRLPPLKGQGSSVINYVQELERVEERLQEFYAGPSNRYKRHHWDMQKARDYEYQTASWESWEEVLAGDMTLQI
ncbi:MAG: hypothetical protein JOS17DRAFT_780289 [Linnemannia elongata]|nr:MAG: hypothetical protein JOS17DRAFT_780289 [Linnemannia elongata]